MTGFEVTVSGEANEDELIADVMYRGRGVADVRFVDERWVVTLYVPPGSDRLAVPLQGFRAALDDACRRLEAVYGHELD